MTGPIVLEGPDGAGKTILAEALLRRAVETDAPKVFGFKNGPPPRGTTGKELRTHYLSQFVSGAVIDRSWPSEMIYGPRTRGASLLGWRDADALREALKAASGVVIVCVPPFEVCRAAWASGRPELLEKESDLFAVWRSYDAWATLYADKPEFMIRYDWTKHDALKNLYFDLGIA